MSRFSPAAVAVEPRPAESRLTDFQQNYVDLLYLAHTNYKEYERKTARIGPEDVRCSVDLGLKSDLTHLLKQADHERAAQIRHLFQQSCDDVLNGREPLYLYVECKADAGPFEKLDHQARRGMALSLQERVRHDQTIWPELQAAP